MKQCINKNCIAYKNITVVGIDDMFCYKCGSKLQEQEQCICGQEIGSLDNFCRKCGKDFKENETETQFKAEETMQDFKDNGLGEKDSL